MVEAEKKRKLARWTESESSVVSKEKTGTWEKEQVEDDKYIITLSD